MTHEPDTNLWPAEDYRLWIRVGATGLTARLLPKAKGEQLLIADLRWQRDRAQTLRHIEDAVYEEHLPIDVYDTEIELEPERMLVAPAAAIYDEDIPEDMYDVMYKAEGGKSDDVVCEQCDEVCFIYGLPRGLKGFIERTFGVADITSPLAKRYQLLANSKGLSTGQHMYVYVRPERMDVLAFSGGNLRLANSFEYTEPSDAVYYILNAWQTSNISQLQGHLHLKAEENADTAPIRELLAKYISHISD